MGRVRQEAEDSTTDPDDSIDADFGQAISGLGDLKDLPQSTVSSVGTSLKQAMVDWNKAQVNWKKWNVDNDKLKKIEESVEDMTTTTSDASLLKITQRVRQGAEDSTTDPDDSIDADFGQAISGLGDLKDLPQSTVSSVGPSLKQAMVDWNKAQVDQKKWNVDNDKLKKIEESVDDM